MMPTKGTCRLPAGDKGAYLQCAAAPKDLRHWPDFLSMMMVRYNGITQPHIRYYELWYEANDTGWWSGSKSAAYSYCTESIYCPMVAQAQAAYAIIHSDPYSMLLTPSVTIIFLCMQALDGHLEMRFERRWFWPFRKMLSTAGEKIPAFIPQANEFARKAARVIGGTAMSTMMEILFDIPTTAHILGGCTMGGSAAEGVVDSRNRVFGYRNMYICDGSVLAANLGVNPSLTICAVTERAMGYIPRPEEMGSSQGNDDGPV